MTSLKNRYPASSTFLNPWICRNHSSVRLSFSLALIMLVLTGVDPISISGTETEGAAPSRSKIVATYGDLEITEDAFYLRANALIRGRTIHHPDAFESEIWIRQILEFEMVPDLIRNEADLRGAEHDERFQWYLGFIRDDYYSKTFKDRIRALLPEPEMIHKGPVEEPEMRDYFDKFVFYTKGIEKYLIHYIYFPRTGGDEAVNTTQRQKADQALARIHKGEDFVDVMIEVTETEDEATTEPFKLSRRYPPHQGMRDVVEKMKPCDITPVLDATAGYYIIYYLPEQNWTDISNFEVAHANPETRQKMVDFILARRPRTKPWDEYLDSLKALNDYREFDPGGLAEGEHPPDEAVLVQLNDGAFTMDDLYNLVDYTVMSSRNISIPHWIDYLQEQKLISWAVYTGRVELDEIDQLGWKDKMIDAYEHWLKQDIRDGIINDDPDLDINIRDQREKAMGIAEESLETLKQAVKDGLIIGIIPDQVDMDRLDMETLHQPFIPQTGGATIKVSE
jgi:hypothetical protein